MTSNKLSDRCHPENLLFSTFISNTTNYSKISQQILSNSIINNCTMVIRITKFQQIQQNSNHNTFVYREGWIQYFKVKQVRDHTQKNKILIRLKTDQMNNLQFSTFYISNTKILSQFLTNSSINNYTVYISVSQNFQQSEHNSNHNTVVYISVSQNFSKFNTSGTIKHISNTHFYISNTKNLLQNISTNPNQFHH